MRRIALTTIWGFAMIATTVMPAAQTPAQKPAFEVASIKPNVTGNSPPSYQAQPGGRLLIGNAPLKLMLALALTLRDYRFRRPELGCFRPMGSSG